MRTPPIATLVLLAVVAPLAAQEKDVARSYRVRLESRIAMDGGGMKTDVVADSTLAYTHLRKKESTDLRFDRLATKSTQNDQVVMDAEMDREGIDDRVTGKKLAVENAPQQARRMLQDSFGIPVCTLTFDADGKETSRKVTDRPGAKDLVAKGQIDNALLFHPPFPAGKDRWTAERAISTGTGLARGALAYERDPTAKDNAVVKVSGTLAFDGPAGPGQPVKLKATYNVRGAQTFDPARREWVAGSLTIDVTLDFVDPAGTRVAGGTGTIKATLEPVK